MKLRNKKTGEIIDPQFGNHEQPTDAILLIVDNKPHYSYPSIAEFNEEWEDYNELEYWFIDTNGDILFTDLDDSKIWKDLAEQRKQIGNYFETKEEAEKAVEKLKAVKRLKDAGFRFGGWETDSDGDLRSVLCNRKDRVQFNNTETLAMAKDLDLLFGGEE